MGSLRAGGAVSSLPVGKAAQEDGAPPWTLVEFKLNFISFRSWLRPQDRVLRRQGKTKTEEQKNERRKSCPSGSVRSCCPATLMREQGKRQTGRTQRRAGWQRSLQAREGTHSYASFENTHQTDSTFS